MPSKALFDICGVAWVSRDQLHTWCIWRSEGAVKEADGGISGEGFTQTMGQHTIATRDQQVHSMYLMI